MVLRLRSHYLAITTVGMVMVLYVIINAEDLTGGVPRIKGIPAETQPWHIVLFIATLATLFQRLE